ncbi:MAG: PPOX class F420-dependent oxidoreductase [bacterium]
MAERPKEMDEFLSEPRMVRLGTTNADGSPHVVPLVYVFDPAEGSFFISTGADSVTTRNLRRNPAVTLCIDDDTAPFRAVIAEGEAQVSEPMGTDHEGIKRGVEHFFGPGAWESYKKTPVAQKIRVRVNVVPKKWAWWDHRRKLMGSARID